MEAWKIEEFSSNRCKIFVCIKDIMDEIVKIIINVVLMATFLGIFFFTYGAYIEKKVVKTQVEYAVNDLMKDIKYFGGNNVSKAFKMIPLPNMEEEDKKVLDSNKELLKRVIIILVLFFGFGMLISYVLAKKYNINLVKILKQSAIILGAIAVTEYSFLTYIGSRYRSLDTNYVKKTIIQALQQ